MSPCATTLLVIAKAPIAGFAKTRLTPPLTPREAARVAAAALLDTLDSVLRSEVTHRVVAFTGDLSAAECSHELARELAKFEVIPQRGAGFGARLANAHADAARFGAPVLQIGMDTPQIGPDVLTSAANQLVDDEAALLGPAEDGGWWALGLPTPQPARVLVDVPMSTDRTGELTGNALQHCGYRVRLLPKFSDVDTFADATRVAAQSTGRFAATIHELSDRGLVLR
ncbi:TIGR04282 family arsenosugar biosynthesis glycosyltransferase [Nocardia sp. CA-128927]|uniref:TIGR04282 family arsenosugar biosynthesis glycosyltransferase n=1 Tax=Nocardia sp. CA-128927 TaxID=3239975 RepID=UPI003D978D3B